MKYMANYFETISWFRDLLILFLLSVTISLSAQDILNGSTSTVSDVESGKSGTFTDLSSATLDVSDVDSVMVVASFETRYGGAVNTRDALFRLTNGTDISATIYRTLKKTGGDDKGIGTLVYIFDASGASGNVTYTLQHSSSTNTTVVSTATLVAIALTTSTSIVNISNELRAISDPVPASATLNEWTGVSGLSTGGIQLDSTGSIYVATSINTDGTSAGTGEWKLQYSSDNSNWIDIGNTASRSISSAADYGISSLAWVIEDLEAGTYYCRLAHRQTSGTSGDIRTLNTNLVACALVYEFPEGCFREFPSFVLESALESTTSTSMTPVISMAGNPADITDMFFQAQYVITASDESDSPAYDLYIDNGILDGTDQERYVSSSTDVGSGGSVGLGLSMQPGTTYTASLRHRSTTGITLNTKNSILTGFQLTSIGNAVWTGESASPTVWNDIDNWNGDAPEGSDNAYIPGGLNYYPVLTSSAECQDLHIMVGGSVTLDPVANLTICGMLTNEGSLSVSSDATNSGSLMVVGSATGEVTYKSYLTADQWHIVSPPVSGQSVNSFLLDESNNIPENTTYNFYGLTDYSESANSWNSFFTSSTGGDFTSGKGYLMRRELSDGTVSYTGNLINSDHSVGINCDSNGWNAVGNPFTSVIGVSADATTGEDFLTKNLPQLDPNYSALYLWDEQAGYSGTQNNYKVIGNAGYVDDYSYPELELDYLQAGQGFLIKSVPGGGSVDFTKEMQVHQSSATVLKSAEKSWDGFKLVARSGDKRESTIVSFHEGMTLGLDPSYDAGLLSSEPDFSLYTRLLSDDEGINFKIQCLPYPHSADVVIPVGLDLLAGGEVSFLTEGVYMPDVQGISLEDRMCDSITDITAEGDTYTVVLEEGVSDPGRFFLHVTAYNTTSIGLNKPIEEIISVSFMNQMIRINGIVGATATATLFDLQGRLMGTQTLFSGYNEWIPASSLCEGIYLLLVNDGNRRETFKILNN
jgi:hypothetical protein